MPNIPIVYFLWAGACLFSTGFAMMVLKRNAIFVLMGIELMLNAANLSFIAFSRQDANHQGLMVGLFVMVVGVCEMAVALALILQVYRSFVSIDINDFKSRN